MIMNNKFYTYKCCLSETDVSFFYSHIYLINFLTIFFAFILPSEYTLSSILMFQKGYGKQKDQMNKIIKPSIVNILSSLSLWWDDQIWPTYLLYGPFVWVYQKSQWVILKYIKNSKKITSTMNMLKEYPLLCFILVSKW